MTTLTKLPCQQLIQCFKAKGLKLQESFSVDKEVFQFEQIPDHARNEFIMSSVRSQNLDSDVLPTWEGMRSLLSKESLSLFQVEYLSFIPHPVTEYSTVYTAMRNFVCLAGQLDQELLPLL